MVTGDQNSKEDEVWAKKQSESKACVKRKYTFKP